VGAPSPSATAAGSTTSGWGAGTRELGCRLNSTRTVFIDLRRHLATPGECKWPPVGRTRCPLTYRDGLATHEGLIDLEPVGCKDKTVHDDLVAGPEPEDIVEHHVTGGQLNIERQTRSP